MRLADIPFEETRAPEPPAPPLSDLLAAGERRSAAARYWIADSLEGGMHLALHGLFSALPPDAASAVGARLGPVFRRRFRHTRASRRLVEAVARLRPDLDTAAAREPLVAAWWRNTLRTLSEFPHLERIAEPDRTATNGAAHAEAAAATGRPIVIVSIHLASWEGSFRMLLNRRVGGRDWVGLYTPQPERVQNRILYRLRRRANAYAFPPSRGALRRIRALLDGGTCNLCLLVDAPIDDEVHFPLFGRRLAERSGLRVAIALARRSGAIVLPGYYLREGPARFSANWLPPLDPSAYPDDEAGTQAIARALSAVFEPVVVANLEHWFMLDRLKFRGLPEGVPPRTDPEAVAAP